jgi:steroid delta-isomerase-like uncharacterized protein
MSTQEENKATYRSIIDAISRGDIEALEGLVAPDIVDHNPIPDQSPGLDGLKEWLVSARTSFPDLEGTVEDVIAEGDRVAARVTWRGTHAGEFAGVPGRGTPVEMSAYHIVRFEAGQATEWWGTADVFGVLRQVGATITGPDATA